LFGFRESYKTPCWFIIHTANDTLSHVSATCTRQCIILLCVTRCRSGFFFTVSYLVIFVQSFDNQLNLFTCERAEFIRARRRDTFEICSTDCMTYSIHIYYIIIYRVSRGNWRWWIYTSELMRYNQDFKYLRSVLNLFTEKLCVQRTLFWYTL